MPQSIAPMIFMMGTQYHLAQREKILAKRERTKQEEKAWAKWEETAFPKPELVEAGRAKGMERITTARGLAEKKLPSFLAGRGFGPGSGAMVEGAGEIETGFLKSIGQLEADLTKFAQTPQFGPGEAGVGKLSEYDPGGSEALQQALGMMMAWQMLKGMGGDSGMLSYPAYEPQLSTGWTPPEYTLNW